MSLIKRIWLSRLSHNQNYLLIFCGGTGSGKSYSSLTIGEICDLNGFKIDNVVFTAAEFMDLINSNKIKHGSVIVWDEAGVGIPSKEWYSISNKAINYVFQTFRNMNLMVIMTTPTIGYVDSGIRKLFHGYLECKGVIKRRNVVQAVYKELTYNPQTDKTYFKYLRTYYKHLERIVAITRMEIKKPSVKLVNAYEKKKKEFTITLNKEVMDDLTKAKEKKKLKEPFDPKPMAEQCIELGIKTIAQIRNAFNIPLHKACRVKALIKA